MERYNIFHFAANEEDVLSMPTTKQVSEKRFSLSLQRKTMLTNSVVEGSKQFGLLKA